MDGSDYYGTNVLQLRWFGDWAEPEPRAGFGDVFVALS